MDAEHGERKQFEHSNEVPTYVEIMHEVSHVRLVFGEVGKFDQPDHTSQTVKLLKSRDSYQLVCILRG
jgi:hypothetical protein